MKSEKFFESALEIAWQGGIMEMETIPLGKYPCSVLKKAKYHRDGNLHLNYDYIHDKKFEPVFLNRKEQIISGVDKENAGAVVRAVCSLYDYCYDHPYMKDEQQLIQRGNQLAWINKVLNEQITDRRTTDAWEIYELLHDWNLLDKEEEVMEQSNYLRGEMLSVMKYMYVSKGEEGLKLMKGINHLSIKDSETYRANDLIQQAVDTVKRIKENTKLPDQEEAEKLLGILKMTRKEKMNLIQEEDLIHFVLYSIIFPPEILTKAIADAFNLDFWNCWKEVKTSNHYENIWKSTDPASYDKPEFMDTAEFLNRSSGAFKNRQLRNQLIDERSLIYCCKKERNGKLSKKTKQFFDAMKNDYEKILQQGNLERISKNRMSALLIILSPWDIYAFEEMVDEFIRHKEEPAYQAAMALLEKKMIEMMDAIDARDFKKQRMELKCLLGLLANKELRSGTLNF